MSKAENIAVLDVTLTEEAFVQDAIVSVSQGYGAIMQYGFWNERVSELIANTK